MPWYGIRPKRSHAPARSDRGFSLTEMLVVIVILGILAGIAVPFFLGQRQKAMRAAMQSDLRNASTALDDAAAAHSGDYTAAGLPLDTPLGNGITIVGMALPGSGGGRGGATSVFAMPSTKLSFQSSPNVVVWIETLSTTTYCINAKHSSMKTLWSFDRTRGVAVEGGCSASSAVPTGIPETTAPGESSTGGGGPSGAATSCDPKDEKCLAQAEADSLGCKIDDESCLAEGRKKAAITEAEKYGCKVGDDSCIEDGKKKAAAQEAVADAKKYGCKVGDVDCLNAGKEKEAAAAAEKAAESEKAAAATESEKAAKTAKSGKG